MERRGSDDDVSGENSGSDESDRKPPRAIPLPARAWLTRTRDGEDPTLVGPDLWRVFLEPPTPAAGQVLSAKDAKREPETHYGTRSELEAIAATYGVGETYVWSPGEKTYRLQT